VRYNIHNMPSLPKLITFDGGARSGKGTIVSLIKDYLRDSLGLKVMLIDAGQVFRVLVTVLNDDHIDFDDSAAIDALLSDENYLARCARRVKEVYHMSKAERDKLLYSSEISINSAKVGARPLSQDFKDNLLRKWLRDAYNEGVEVVLLDGRALEEVGGMLAAEGLCQYVLGLFFVCDPIVSAQRTLGLMPRPYEELSDALQHDVDELVRQIEARNLSDQTRAVHPVMPPAGAPVYLVSELPDHLPPAKPCPMVIVDRSVELPFHTMAQPVIRLVEHYVR
jgi:cytidylate kinase